MKVVILAGGFGTRLGELTHLVPKPMVPIGKNPILREIMEIFISYGHSDFIIALGYKGNVIKDYFLNLQQYASNISIDFRSKTNHPEYLETNSSNNFKVSLVDTGEGSLTGGRLGFLKKFVGSDDFFLTYGDGLSNIDLDKLLAHHKSKNLTMTVTAVRPPARFGEILFDDSDNVLGFQEKPLSSVGWINGGFMICKKEIFNLIDSPQTILEKDVMEALASRKDIAAYKHHGFWQCMDTKRDKDYLDELANMDSPPWRR